MEKYKFIGDSKFFETGKSYNYNDSITIDGYKHNISSDIKEYPGDWEKVEVTEDGNYFYRTADDKMTVYRPVTEPDNKELIKELLECVQELVNQYDVNLKREWHIKDSIEKANKYL